MCVLKTITIDYVYLGTSTHTDGAGRTGGKGGHLAHTKITLRFPKFVGTQIIVKIGK